MKRLLLETSVPKIYMLVMISISVLMLGGYFSYAMFTVQKEKKSAISIVTGNLTGTLTVDGVSSNHLVVPANTTKTFTVVLSNNNARKARYNFYYTGTLASNISAGCIVEAGSNTPPSATGVILEATGTAGSSASYKIKVKNNSSSSVTISLGYQVGLENIDLALPSNSNLFTEMPKEPALVEELLASYTNPSSITTYAAGDKTKMYTFKQPARAQQTGYTAEELTEYRYIGKTPNNYITFNGEPWRIIGVFTVEDKDGKKEQRVKIMREESIGDYSWDNTNAENSYGKNRWSDARLNYLLNPGHESESIGGSLYWNKGSGTCYYGQNNGTTSCNFTSTGLTDDAKSKIEEAKWYLGGYDWSGTHSAELFHEKERGTTIYSSTTYPRETSWVGSVGLMYPSDYGYTYSLGVDTTCYGNLNSCHSSGGGIPANGWMFNSASQWTLSSLSSTSYLVFFVLSSSYVSYSNAFSVFGVRPVVYLKSDIQLTGGSGTSNDPYTILS